MRVFGTEMFPPKSLFVLFCFFSYLLQFHQGLSVCACVSVCAPGQCQARWYGSWLVGGFWRTPGSVTEENSLLKFSLSVLRLSLSLSISVTLSPSHSAGLHPLGGRVWHGVHRVHTGRRDSAVGDGPLWVLKGDRKWGKRERERETHTKQERERES